MTEKLPADPNPSASESVPVEDAPDGDAEVNPALPKTPAPLFMYTLARIGLFLIVALVLKFAGVKSPLLILVLAALASGILSFFLLNRLRDGASVTVYKGVSKVKTKLDARRDEEDAAAEQIRLEQEARRAGTDPEAEPAN
jgi:hypothetical protein